MHNLPECDTPVTVGWQFSTVVVVPPQASSHTYILSNRRIPTAQTPDQVAAAQLKELRPYFAERPINLGDRYYPTKDFLVAVSPDYDLLTRLKANRVFYRPAPIPVIAAGSGGKRRGGAPAKHGPRFQCKSVATHTQADRQWQGVDEAGGKLEVSEWQGLHLREAVELNLRVMRVRRFGASGKAGDPLESWLVWAGQSELELSAVVATYKRRFSIEHTFRFIKQDLLWEKAGLHTPAQFELWSNVVAFVLNELVLARSFNQAYRRPWESKEREASPQQVRRGMAPIIATLGSPARQAKGRGKSPGRAKGSLVGRRKRWSVVKKAVKKPGKVKKQA